MAALCDSLAQQRVSFEHFGEVYALPGCALTLLSCSYRDMYMFFLVFDRFHLCQTAALSVQSRPPWSKVWQVLHLGRSASAALRLVVLAARRNATGAARRACVFGTVSRLDGATGHLVLPQSLPLQRRPRRPHRAQCRRSRSPLSRPAPRAPAVARSCFTRPLSLLTPLSSALLPRLCRRWGLCPSILQTRPSPRALARCRGHRPAMTSCPRASPRRVPAPPRPRAPPLRSAPRALWAPQVQAPLCLRRAGLRPLCRGPHPLLLLSLALSPSPSLLLARRLARP
jgi:hypothetical protein